MISASLQQRKTRTRRSMLFVPGANAAMVSNSFIYPADALMFDLEDSVALREKDTARRMVYHALQHPLYRDIETIVRVNALDSEWGVPGSRRSRWCGRCASAENRYRSGCSGY